MSRFFIFITSIIICALTVVSCNENGPVGEVGILGIAKKDYYIPSSKTTLDISVTHNIAVSVEIPADAGWIRYSPSAKAVTDTGFRFDIDENKADTERQTVVRFFNAEEELSCLVTVTQAAFLPDPGPDPEPSEYEFDAKNIVYSFGNLSDTHVDGINTMAGQKFKNALNQLQNRAKLDDNDGLDAVLIAGDLANSPYSSTKYYAEFDYVKKIYESVLNVYSTPLIYTPGNHDTYGQWSSNTIAEAQNISSRLGEAYFRTDLDMQAKQTLECRHCKVGDFHVLCIVPNGSGPVGYNNKSVAWLDATLESITRENPRQYVFILTHPMIYDTVYGSLLGPDWMNGHCGNSWYTKALTDVLRKYPQAVTFSGHLHFPINDPRSIWQGDFTSLGCGSCRYMAIEDGEYMNMSSTTVMQDANDVSSGLLTQIDRNGNVRITRMFFSQTTTFGQPWFLEHPRADGKHLERYDHRTMKAANTAPVLGSVNVSISGNNVKALFASGRDDQFVHRYIITLKKSGAVVSTFKVLSDFYRNALPSLMKPTWEVPLGTLSDGSYEVSLVAYDSWDAASNTVTKSFTVGN